ncbi:MAG: GntR family transcriptional regulator [Acidimicrobiia bacterium]|nr:GntR family transcriptional regulator [Acidimicrobiia bacterium]
MVQPLSDEQLAGSGRRSPALLEPLPRIKPEELLADRAYREMSRAIITRRIDPGTTLSVPELARQLNISRSPVREAVQRLIHEGLAEKRGRRGIVVACIGREDLMSLLQVRILLDGLAARRAAEEATEDDIAALNNNLEEHRAHVASGEIDRSYLINLDLEFHAAIRDAVGSEDLSVLLARVHARTHLSYAADYRYHAIDPLPDHQAIAEAIAARDPDRAERAAQQHVMSVRDGYLAGIEDTDGLGPCGES